MKLWPLLSLALASIANAQANYKVSSDFKEVVNAKAFQKSVPLAAEHLEALRKNLFFVSPADEHQLYYIYGTNDYENIPSLITVDNVLQLYHVFFDATLRNAEEKSLLPEVSAMTAAMIRQSTARWRSVKGTNLESAALKNIAYFGVVDRLLGGSQALPADAKQLVTDELSKIKAAQGFGSSAIFPYEIDYSQFIVRGHYSKTPALGRYFKTMMWYGLIPISIDQRRNQTVVPLPEQARMAALMVDDLFASGAAERWSRIYDVTSVFVGESNNLTPAQWRKAVAPVLGSPIRLATLKTDAGLAAMVAAVRKASKPKIVLKKNDVQVAGDTQLRFMGQRSIPDSVVINRLTDTDLRPFPSSLDVATVLGSTRAASLLDSNPAVYNPKGWPDYVPERNKIAGEWAAMSNTAWRENLYLGWLDSLRAVVRPAGDKHPAFMRSAAWRDKSISTALASWAELRHDTILYGMQTVAEMGGGDEEPPPVKGYVEPNVELYARLGELVATTRGALTKFGYLNSKAKEQFAQFSDVLSFFLSVSRRELNGTPLSAAEHKRIRNIEGVFDDLNSTIQLIGTNYQQLSESDLDMAQVADIHTAMGQALTVAAGRADDLIAVVPIEGKLYFARGSVFSFYEFAVPVSERMTDSAWQQMLTDGKAPARPAWISSYFVDKRARPKED